MEIENSTIFNDWLEITRELSPRERGRLAQAISAYADGQDWRSLITGNEKYVFPVYKMRVDRFIKSERVKAIRNSEPYRAWRHAVFERDMYTCQLCGQSGRRLNAHHIKRFSEFPDERLNIDNGITLCVTCHKEIHHKGK